MAGELRKLTTVTVIAGSPGMPGDPGQPYRPMRVTRKTEYVTTWEPVALDVAYLAMRGALNSSTGVTDFSRLFAGMRGGNTLYWQQVTRKVTTVTYIPEQPYRPPRDPIPATPEQRLQDFHLGWNSGARSAATYRGNLVYRFKVLPSVVGVITGLSATAADTGVSYGEIQFGLHFTGNHFRVVERGEAKTPFDVFAAADSFAIERRGYEVRYLRNDAVFYTSLTRAL